MLHDRTSHPTRSTAQQPRLVATAILSLASLAALLVALSVRARAAPPPPLATPGRLRGWWDSGETIDLVGQASRASPSWPSSPTWRSSARSQPWERWRRARSSHESHGPACPRVVGAVLAGTVVLTPTSIAAAAERAHPRWAARHQAPARPCG